MPRRLPEPSRTAALARGETRYLSDRPCKAHGHVGYRFTVSTACCSCKGPTGNKPGRPKKSSQPAQPKIARAQRIGTVKRIGTAAKGFNRPAFARAQTDYHQTIEARESSAYLDGLIRDITATKRVPDGHSRKTQ